MKIMEFLIPALGEHARSHTARYDGAGLPRGILIVDENTCPRADYICIFTAGSVGEDDIDAIDGFASHCYAFMTADAQAEYEIVSSLPDTSACSTSLDLVPLYNRLQDALDDLGSSSYGNVLGNVSFSEFIHDVIKMKLLREDEIFDTFMLFPSTTDLPYRVMVFEFDDKKPAASKYSILQSHLSKTFLRVNTANYFGRVVAIVQPPSGESDAISLPKKQFEMLKEISDSMKLRCAICSSTINWQVLRTEIMKGFSVLQIAPFIESDVDKRVYYVESYMMYLTMDWCFRAYVDEFHHDNYIYLLHPGVAQIIRYDTEKNSNLREILLTYLLNDCNAAKTAEDLFMHRNTIIYKLKKIKTLLTVGLDDPVIRQRILWSCMMADYCQRVLELSSEHYPGYNASGLYPIRINPDWPLEEADEDPE